MQFNRTILNEIPSIHDIEKSMKAIPNSSPYKQMMEYGYEQISLFEKKTLGIDEEKLFNIKIETDLEPGEIPLTTLGMMSNGIQRVYTSICNEMFGNKKSFGKIPATILNSSELVMVASSPGSYNMHLASKINSMNDNLSTLERLFYELIQEPDASFVVEEYGVRTFKILNEWFDKINQYNIEFSIKNQNSIPINFDIHSLELAKQKLNDISTSESSETIELVGIIESANSSSNTITILLNSGEKITAHCSNNLFDSGLTIKTILYKFTCTKTSITHITSKQKKQRYSIQDFEIL